MGRTNEQKRNSKVSSEDIDFILGTPKTHTWEEFYRELDRERSSGSYKCPQASYIALELLTPQILSLPWKSMRTNSETHQDMISSAYLIITDHIGEFDRAQSSFKTFIMKWMQGLAREIRSDGISKYQQDQFGCAVYSSDALLAKSSMDDNAETVFEFVDENSAIEDIVERKEKARSSALLHQMMNIGEKLENDEEKKNAYMNAACYNLFLGGVNNMPDVMKNDLEEMVFSC